MSRGLTPAVFMDAVYGEARRQKLLNGGTPKGIRFFFDGYPASMTTNEDADAKFYWIGGSLEVNGTIIAAHRVDDTWEWRWDDQYRDADMVALLLALPELAPL